MISAKLLFLLLKVHLIWLMKIARVLGGSLQIPNLYLTEADAGFTSSRLNLTRKTAKTSGEMFGLSGRERGQNDKIDESRTWKTEIRYFADVVNKNLSLNI